MKRCCHVQHFFEPLYVWAVLHGGGWGMKAQMQVHRNDCETLLPADPHDGRVETTLFVQISKFFIKPPFTINVWYG